MGLMGQIGPISTSITRGYICMYADTPIRRHAHTQSPSQEAYDGFDQAVDIVLGGFHVYFQACFSHGG